LGAIFAGDFFAFLSFFLSPLFNLNLKKPSLPFCTSDFRCLDLFFSSPQERLWKVERDFGLVWFSTIVHVRLLFLFFCFPFFLH